MSSAILSADDLNDFISPGVACIKPIETLPKTDESNPYEVTTEDKVQAQNPAPASISLTDCLACSGCVTSAEAVLVSLQSHTEVLNTLDSYATFEFDNDSCARNPIEISSDAKIFVASVSPQVRASLAATLGISERKAGRIVEQFLSGSQGLRLGGKHGSYFNYVFDTNRTREACLVLGADEVAESLADPSKHKPIISSACPGWICYAEKTHPHILPHLSALKSPQALSGILIKSVLSKVLGIHPSQIWHLAIMPCFDKKLEASREELTDQWWSDSAAVAPESSLVTPVRDVDCVITSRELLTLASSRGIVLANLPTTPLSSQLRHTFPDSLLAEFLLSPSSRCALQVPEAATSGGYLYHVLQSQQHLHPGSTISAIRGRNVDMIEYTLTSASGQTLFKSARYYGFRNIQNLVRKLKPAKAALPGATARTRKGVNGISARGSGSDYAYVEVMACPGGCTNGGGQIKLEDVASFLPETRGEEVVASVKSPVSQKEWLARVDEAYFSADTESENEGEAEGENMKMQNGHTNGQPPQSGIVNGIDTGRIHKVLHHWSQLVDLPLSKLCYTTYRKVESDVGKKKNVGDTERIAAIAGMSGGGW